MKAVSWDKWRGSLDGRPTMLIKNILSHRGYKLDVHAFVREDDLDCFHTHSALSFRIVLWGGYIEELENGTKNVWFPLRFGFVTPEYSHRVDKIIFSKAYSLWIRWPKTHETQLAGKGWVQQADNSKHIIQAKESQ